MKTLTELRIEAEALGAKITCTNGNGSNGIRGSRITVTMGKEKWYVYPTRRDGWKYVTDYPGGKYAEQMRHCLESAING